VLAESRGSRSPRPAAHSLTRQRVASNINPAVHPHPLPTPKHTHCLRMPHLGLTKHALALLLLLLGVHFLQFLQLGHLQHEQLFVRLGLQQRQLQLLGGEGGEGGGSRWAGRRWAVEAITLHSTSHHNDGALLTNRMATKAGHDNRRNRSSHAGMWVCAVPNAWPPPCKLAAWPPAHVQERASSTCSRPEVSAYSTWNFSRRRCRSRSALSRKRDLRARVCGSAWQEVRTIDYPTHSWALLTLAHTARRALKRRDAFMHAEHIWTQPHKHAHQTYTYASMHAYLHTCTQTHRSSSKARSSMTALSFSSFSRSSS
jgi:hypothetical protein